MAKGIRANARGERAQFSQAAPGPGAKPQQHEDDQQARRGQPRVRRGGADQLAMGGFVAAELCQVTAVGLVKRVDGVARSSDQCRRLLAQQGVPEALALLLRHLSEDRVDARLDLGELPPALAQIDAPVRRANDLVDP